jgi:MFS family permease
MGRDRQILYTTSFLRSLRTGAVGILIGLYLPKLGLTTTEMGVVIGAGLLANAVAAFVATFAGDRLGRRHAVAAIALLMGLGGLALALSSHPLVLAIAAFVGMVNGNGRDRGAVLILEQAMVPSLATDRTRTKVFAWFNVAGDFGLGVGALLAMAPDALVATGLMGDLAALRAVLVVCAVLVLATAPLSLALSRAVEPTHDVRTPAVALTPQSKKVVTRIGALFFIDALGGGFITTAWLAYYFQDHFHAGIAAIGALFILARIANALSHVAAAWLARRIGLVNTMVWTSLPSSFLLLTVLVAPSFEIAAILFVLREGLAQMDVPTRQSYCMAVVRPSERTFVSGVTQLVRLVAWAIAPFFVGWLMTFSEATPFYLGAGLKIVYIVLLYGSMRGIRPPEEAEVPTRSPSAVRIAAGMVAAR